MISYNIKNFSVIKLNLRNYCISPYFFSNQTCEEALQMEFEYNKTLTFSYPNTVIDELGNKGTWTIVDNQGFEVSK